MSSSTTTGAFSNKWSQSGAISSWLRDYNQKRLVENNVTYFLFKLACCVKLYVKELVLYVLQN